MVYIVVAKERRRILRNSTEKHGYEGRKSQGGSGRPARTYRRTEVFSKEQRARLNALTYFLKNAGAESQKPNNSQEVANTNNCRTNKMTSSGARTIRAPKSKSKDYSNRTDLVEAADDDEPSSSREGISGKAPGHKPDKKPWPVSARDNSPSPGRVHTPRISRTASERKVPLILPRFRPQVKRISATRRSIITFNNDGSRPNVTDRPSLNPGALLNPAQKPVERRQSLSSEQNRPQNPPAKTEQRYSSRRASVGGSRPGIDLKGVKTKAPVLDSSWQELRARIKTRTLNSTAFTNCGAIERLIEQVEKSTKQFEKLQLLNSHLISSKSTANSIEAEEIDKISRSHQGDGIKYPNLKKTSSTMDVFSTAIDSNENECRKAMQTSYMNGFAVSSSGNGIVRNNYLFGLDAREPRELNTDLKNKENPGDNDLDSKSLNSFQNNIKNATLNTRSTGLIPQISSSCFLRKYFQTK